MDLNYLNRYDVVQNVSAVPYLLLGREPTAATLRSDFFTALNTVQSHPLRWREDVPLICFTNEHLVAHLIQKGVWAPEDIRDDRHLFHASEHDQIISQINAGIEVIKNINLEIVDLLDLVISEFTCLKKPLRGGGSLSSLIGLIWLNPQPEWNEIKFGEVIFHEWVHHSLFLEDMVRRLFTATQDQMEKPPSLVTSAILKTQRSFDKSYHSAAVAVSMMYFYHRLGDDNTVQSLQEPTRRTVRELREREHLLAPRGQELLASMEAFVDRPDYGAIDHLLSAGVAATESALTA